MTYTEEDPNMDDCRATHSEIEEYRCAREWQMMDKPRARSSYIHADEATDPACGRLCAEDPLIRRLFIVV